METLWVRQNSFSESNETVEDVNVAAVPNCLPQLVVEPHGWSVRQIKRRERSKCILISPACHHYKHKNGVSPPHMAEELHKSSDPQICFPDCLAQSDLSGKYYQTHKYSVPRNIEQDYGYRYNIMLLILVCGSVLSLTVSCGRVNLSVRPFTRENKDNCFHIISPVQIKWFWFLFVIFSSMRPQILERE